MEQDHQQISGWRKFRFGFGAGDKPIIEKPDAIEIRKRGDRCCEYESCGEGCFVTQVDFDQLDQQ